MKNKSFLLVIILVMVLTKGFSQVSGTVYRELSINGSSLNDYGAMNSNELGVEGVTVTIYPGGASTITASDGTWSIAGAGALRVEFSNWPSYLEESFDGGNGNSSVQFVTAPASNVNFGLHNPADFTQLNPYISTSVHYERDFGGVNSGRYAFLKWPTSAIGDDFTTNQQPNSPNGSFEGITVASFGDIGCTYGLAWQSKTGKLYLGAYHKRFSGYGPNGPDAIYQLDPNTNSVTGVIELDVLTGTPNSCGSDPHDFATMVNGEIYDVGVGNSSFDGVGKIALGDLELSDDESTLFVVNLNDRKIYVLNVNDGTTANASLLQSWTVPDPCGGAIGRPFGLGVKDGVLYVGTTCDDASNAYIYSTTINISNPSPSFNLELTIPLNYTRQPVLDSGPSAGSGPDDMWHAWESNPNAVSYAITTSSKELWYPEPILTDIEFDQGAMIIGLRDRLGDQSGSRLPFNSTSGLTWGTAGGDIIRACKSGGAFTLESGINGAGNCDSGGGLPNSGVNGYEFYYWDLWHWNPINPNAANGGFHWELTQGALVQLQGDDDIITTSMDPIDDYSGGILRLKNDGTRDGGHPNSAYTLFDTGEYGGSGSPNGPSFAKANGLGDLEVLSDPAPLELGNLVWEDLDSDGIQDADEPGISGVTVQLVQGGAVIATATTDANGNYIFSNDPNGTDSGSHKYNITQLEVGMDYIIRIPNISGANKQAALGANNITISNSGEGTNADRNDSDGITSGDDAEVSVTAIDLPRIGANNHSFDCGFSAAPPPCDFLIATTQLSTCVGGFFDANLTLDWSNGPTTGGFEYRVDNGAFQPLARTNFSANAVGEPVTIPDLVCEVTKFIEIRFAVESSCYAQMQFIFPPADPSGYIYCVESGEIISGGTINVTPPAGGSINIIEDGSNGHYQWLAVGSPVVSGLYQMSITAPAGYANTGSAGDLAGDTDDILDPTAGSEDNPSSDDPLVLGSDLNGGGTNLQDFALGANPFFMDFNLDLGDPLIDLNNLPLSGCQVCSISIVSAIPTACDSATSTYNLAVTVSYSTAPGGNITITTDNGLSKSFVSTGTSPETFTFTGISSDGVTGIDVTATFDDENTCTTTSTDAYDAPESCCHAPYEMCPGESYTLTAQAGFSNYQWQKDDGTGTFVDIPGATNQTYIADEFGRYFVSAEDATGCPVELCCIIEIIESANCCQMNIPVTTVECDDNGTPGITTDDTFTYTIMVTGTGTSTYTISGSDTRSNLVYGVVNGPYGPFNESDGDLILTVTDDVDNTCQQAPVIITAPAPCSVCPPPVCLPIGIINN